MNTCVIFLPLPSDFGIVLGCKIYVKEITNRSAVNEKDVTLQEGDIIHKVSTDRLTDCAADAAFRKKSFSLLINSNISNAICTDQ